MFSDLMNFFIQLLNNIPQMFTWLVTPWEWLYETFQIELAPIYLLCGVGVIALGMIRALT